MSARGVVIEWANGAIRFGRLRCDHVLLGESCSESSFKEPDILCDSSLNLGAASIVADESGAS